MLRIRIHIPKGGPTQQHDHQDSIHDAVVNGLIAAGANSAELIGHQAKPWTFAPLGWHRGHTGIVHSLIISTADAGLARVLSRLDPAQLVKRRWGEASINFSAAQIQIEPDPILPQQTQLACLMLSPLVLRDRRSDKEKRWHRNLQDVGEQLSDVINRKLSFVAGRTVQLQLYPDPLYLRANPRHSVLVSLKTLRDGRKSFVIGMQAPLVLEGSEDDLRLAWYAGIGEKTRSGFGCLGLVEQGVGR